VGPRGAWGFPAPPPPPTSHPPPLSRRDDDFGGGDGGRHGHNPFFQPTFLLNPWQTLELAAHVPVSSNVIPAAPAKRAPLEAPTGPGVGVGGASVHGGPGGRPTLADLFHDNLEGTPPPSDGEGDANGDSVVEDDDDDDGDALGEEEEEEEFEDGAGDGDGEAGGGGGGQVGGTSGGGGGASSTGANAGAGVPLAGGAEGVEEDDTQATRARWAALLAKRKAGGGSS
jgi:hypothetical protein